MNKHLPLIEDTKSSRLRSPKEIAERLVGCTISAIGGETADRKLLDQIIGDFGARILLTDEEKEFLDVSLDDKQSRVQFSWRYERSWVLLWALGYVDDLVYPSSQCDVPKIAETLHGKSVQSLIAGAKPRGQQEILDAADLIYRLHWAVRDAQLNKKAPPEGIDGGVVMERHAALNWLINYMNQDWDEITTDT